MPFPYIFPFAFEEEIVDRELIRILVDWDSDGVLTRKDITSRGFCASRAQVAEDVTANVLSETPIKISRGRDQVRQLAPPMVGDAEFDLYNASRIYSPENSTGLLYSKLIPGCQVQILSDENDVIRQLFTGYLDDLQVHPELPSRSVGLPCLGSLSRLKGKAEGQKISTQLYQSITTDVALGYILDAVGWPAADRVLATGKTTLAWWWLDNEDAFSAAVALLNSEGPGAALYEDGQGRIVFEDRHYRLTTDRCATSQVTFYDADTEPMHSEPFKFEPRLKDVINICSVTHKTRAAGSTGEIWALGQTVNLGSNEVRSYEAKGSDIFTAASTPSSSGGDFSVSVGSLSSVGLDRTSGASCKITLTAGALGATVTGLRLRAQLVEVSNTVQVSQTISSTASQTKYGQQTYTLATRSEIALNTLQDFTNAVVAYYQEPRAVAEITVVGASTSRLLQIMTREISDRVTVQESQTGLNAACYIERIEHDIGFGGYLHTARFGVEKVTDQDFARWGSVGTVYTRWASTGFTSTDSNRGRWGY